jgi:hypothetical protein
MRRAMVFVVVLLSTTAHDQESRSGPSGERSDERRSEAPTFRLKPGLPEDVPVASLVGSFLAAASGTTLTAAPTAAREEILVRLSDA